MVLEAAFALVFALLFALLGVLAAFTPVYALVFAVASFAGPRRERPVRGSPRLTVLVPAHNESELIERCVRSLLDQSYAAANYRVVVIADNCTDATATIAAAAGAEVMVRSDLEHRGKGRALRWAMDILLARPEAPDGVVIVDADSVADREMIAEMAASYAAGHESVQADDLLRNETGSLRGELEAMAMILRNQVRFRGRTALRMPVTLCGNGMLLSSAVLRSQPWGAFSAVEDGEYALMLGEAGVPTVFAPRAKIYASTTASSAGAYTQGVRWEGGRFQLMRVWLPRMLRAAWRRRDAGLLATAVDEATLPLSASLALNLLGAAASVLLLSRKDIDVWAALPWLVGAASIPLYVVAALASARLPRRSYLALLTVPAFLFLKLRVYARLMRGFERTWVRTERPAENVKRTMKG